jgi:hypothetical protein
MFHVCSPKTNYKLCFCHTGRMSRSQCEHIASQSIAHICFRIQKTDFKSLDSRLQEVCRRNDFEANNISHIMLRILIFSIDTIDSAAACMSFDRQIANRTISSHGQHLTLILLIPVRFDTIDSIAACMSLTLIAQRTISGQSISNIMFACAVGCMSAARKLEPEPSVSHVRAHAQNCFARSPRLTQ